MTRIHLIERCIPSAILILSFVLAGIGKGDTSVMLGFFAFAVLMTIVRGLIEASAAADRKASDDAVKDTKLSTLAAMDALLRGHREKYNAVTEARDKDIAAMKSKLDSLSLAQGWGTK